MILVVAPTVFNRTIRILSRVCCPAVVVSTSSCMWKSRFLKVKAGERTMSFLQYVELNPVREGLAALTKEWKAGSA